MHVRNNKIKTDAILSFKRFNFKIEIIDQLKDEYTNLIFVQSSS